MLLTKQLVVTINLNFHKEKIIWKSMATTSCLVTNIL